MSPDLHQHQECQYPPSPSQQQYSQDARLHAAPPATSTSTSTSTSTPPDAASSHDRALRLLTARFVPQGEFKYASAFVNQSVVAISDPDVWMCDSGASDHMTRNAEHVLNRQAPSKQQQWVMIGDGRAMKVLRVGSLNLELHGDTDVGVQLPRVYVEDGLAINLLSLHTIQAKHPITLESKGVHIFGGEITFPCGDSGSFLRATRLSPSHPVRLAAATSVSPLSPPVEPSVPQEDNFLPPPPIAVEMNGVHVDNFPAPAYCCRDEWSAC